MKEYFYNVIRLKIDEGLKDHRIMGGGYILLEDSPINSNVSIKLHADHQASIPMRNNHSIEADGVMDIYVSADAIISGEIVFIVASNNESFKMNRPSTDIEVSAIGEFDQIAYNQLLELHANNALTLATIDALKEKTLAAATIDALKEKTLAAATIDALKEKTLAAATVAALKEKTLAAATVAALKEKTLDAATLQAIQPYQTTIARHSGFNASVNTWLWNHSYTTPKPLKLKARLWTTSVLHRYKSSGIINLFINDQLIASAGSYIYQMPNYGTYFTFEDVFDGDFYLNAGDKVDIKVYGDTVENCRFSLEYLDRN